MIVNRYRKLLFIGALSFGVIAASYNIYAASFYRAYCSTENKWLGNWSNQEKVAENTRNYHLRSHSDHTVEIETK